MIFAIISLDKCHRRFFYMHRKKFLNLLREREKLNLWKVFTSSISIIVTFNSFEYETNQKHTDNSKVIAHVYLNLADFKHNSIDPLHILNDKWFLHLSEVDIFTEVSCLLQLGNNFGLPAHINKELRFLSLSKILNITTNG